MKRRFISSSLITVVVGLVLSLPVGKPAYAVTVTLTGAELYALQPITSFPTVGATVSGSSLIFDPTTAANQKLFVLPVSVAGSYLINMNLTRLAGTSPFGPGDHDPQLAIGNGTSIVAVGAFDDSLDPGGGRGLTYDDGGTVGTNRQSEILFNGYAQPYPSIGDDFTISADFSLSNLGTQVALSVLGSSATYNTSVALLPSLQLYIALMGENDVGEHYQLNWISITSPSPSTVPLPGALPLFATGLGALGLLGWWRKRKQVAA